MAHVGDLVVTSAVVNENDILGITRVRKGGKLVSSGKLTGGLVIDEGGNAVISGQVDRNIVNNGNLVLSGRVTGKILGSGKLVLGSKAHVSNEDLPIEPAPNSPVT
jgi:hypothetical protein